MALNRALHGVITSVIKVVYIYIIIRQHCKGHCTFDKGLVNVPNWLGNCFTSLAKNRTFLLEM
jgi:hypothetical protein